jgi:hypothetical protein
LETGQSGRGVFLAYYSRTVVFRTAQVAQLLAFIGHHYGVFVLAVFGFRYEFQPFADLKFFPNFEYIIVLQSGDKTMKEIGAGFYHVFSN